MVARRERRYGFARGSRRIPDAQAGDVRIERSAKEERRKYLASDYILESDGTVGLQIMGRDPNDELVIDPALSVTYFSFLGGDGKRYGGERRSGFEWLRLRWRNTTRRSVSLRRRRRKAMQ